MVCVGVDATGGDRVNSPTNDKANVGDIIQRFCQPSGHVCAYVLVWLVLWFLLWWTRQGADG